MADLATTRRAIRAEIADNEQRIVVFQSRREQARDAGDWVSEWHCELEVDRLIGVTDILRKRLLP